MPVEEPYSKREIDKHHEGLHDKLDEIKELVVYTNGKVKRIIIAGTALAAYVLGVSGIGLPTILNMFL